MALSGRRRSVEAERGKSVFDFRQKQVGGRRQLPRRGGAEGQGHRPQDRIGDLREGQGSGFDLAKRLAAAKNLAEAMELHATYWRNQISALQSQAEEMRTLSTKVTADAAEPIKTQMTRGLD